MANFCEQCRNIVFIPRIIDNERDFEAVIHPSLSALEKSAASNWCSFCNVLLGMIEHHRRNEHVTHTSLPTETISLFLQLPCDEGNDWEILHDSTDSVEEARYLRFHHPFGGDAFRILNPEVLTLSETSHRAQAGSSAEGYHFEHAAISSEDTSTGSDEALAVARRWLDTCRNTHQICETPRDHAYGAFEVPSRLLDVSNATVHDGSVFLVSTPQIQRPQYATLSHRWDPNESCLLTTVNERALMLQGILVNQLPRKFADASITAHKLGLQYIWIDSLCILQDSDADKAKQIPQMGSFYENAEVNLSASSDGLGMWKERNGRVTRPFGLAVTINDPNLDAGYARVILKVTPLIRCRRSHLESRVWILQERIFARRTLFFDPWWVSFDCAKMCATETFPDGMHKTTRNSSYLERRMETYAHRDYALSMVGGDLRRWQNLARITHHLTMSDRRALHLSWLRIVENYSVRFLTYESDRLLAVSSLARRLSHILNDSYIAGMWKDEIITHLQWQYTNSLSRNRARQSTYRAPTWSWASVEHRFNDNEMLDTHMLEWKFSGAMNEQMVAEDSQSEVEILNITWHNSVPEYGNVLDAKLELLGRPIKGHVYLSTAGPDMSLDFLTINDVLEESVTGTSTRVEPMVEAVPSGTWYLYASGKTALGSQERTTVSIFADSWDEIAALNGVGYLLPVSRRFIGGYWDLYCLVLKEVNTGTFERVGCARSLPSSMLVVKERAITLI